ncbi:MAG: molecular chaperone GroEL [Nevskia sp.]|jgi:chaperonin GroEL|nr:molecular chaperone GroEL [Nevskia sp.]MCK9385720.1 molecular chaperone GroEL [Nevskia sp.]
MAKKILYNGTVRQEMLAGINILADAVQVTLGPHGRTVLIEHRTAGVAPIVTKDGATVAKSIDLTDRCQNAGARMLQHLVSSVSKGAGDGTTTSVVLARRLALESIKGVAQGIDPMGIRAGLELAVKAVGADLKRRARACSDHKSIAHVATVAANGDADIGELLATAVDQSGHDGVVVVELGQGIQDEIEIVEGTRWAQGYASPYFVTDSARKTAELDDPYILFYDRVIRDFGELIPLLDQVTEQKASLLIVAEEVDASALPSLLLNHIRGVFRCVVVKPPGFGDHRADTLTDLAVLTGGTALLEASGKRLATVTLADLGRARRAVITEGETTLLGVGGDPAEIQARLSGLRLAQDEVRTQKGPMSPTGQQHAIEGFEDRIKALAGTTAIVKVGAPTEAAVKERMQRVENAHNALSAAMKEGVLGGGGVALLRSRTALEALQGRNAAQDFGIEIVRRALEEPIRQISRNSGRNAAEIILNILKSEDEFWGYDASVAVYGDLFDLGVIDPITVTRTALEHAASIAGTMVTAECAVIMVPLDDPTFGYTAEWAAATREDPRA